MKNIITDDSLIEAIEIMKEINDKGLVSEERLKSYFNTPGIQLMKRHMKQNGNVEFDLDMFRKFFYFAKSNKETKNIFVGSIRRGCATLHKYEELYKALDYERIVSASLYKVEKFLPNKFNANFSLHIMFGIRGTGIVLSNDIAVDLCDESLEADGCFDENLLVDLIAHELHHIVSEKYIKQLITSIKNEEHNFVKLIGEILSEGTANYYLTNPYEKNMEKDNIWIKNEKDMNNLIEIVNRVLHKSKNNADYKSSDSWNLFDESMIGYSVGFEIVKLIDQAFGKTKVMECIEDCRKTIHYFNDAIDKLDIDRKKL